MSRRTFIACICFSLLTCSLAFSASGDESEDVLERKSTSELLREADRELKSARKAAGRGGMTSAEPALERYARRIEIVNRRIDRDPVGISPDTGVFRNVERATSRHTRILEGLLLDAPDAARPGLMRAIEASRIGHRRALENLERARSSQRDPAGVRSGERRGPPSTVGPPAGAGRGPGPGAGQRRPRGGPPPF